MLVNRVEYRIKILVFSEKPDVGRTDCSDCTCPMVKHGGGSMKVWACLAASEPGRPAALMEQLILKYVGEFL